MSLPFAPTHSGHLIPFALTAAPNGGWVWFSDPRAVYDNGYTFVGYTDNDGNYVAARYNHATGAVDQTFVLYTSSVIDDHQNPVFLVRASDSRLLAFYRDTSAGECLIRVSTNPDDVSAWGAPTDVMSQLGAATRYYHRPHELPGESGTPMYLWLSTNDISGLAKIFGYSKSTDGGTTWSTYTSIYQCTTWVYEKMVVNGTDRFDFAVTDNHPTDGATSIYHFYYHAGSYYKSDGTLITAGLPFSQTAPTKVYDGSSISSWIWDIAIDPATSRPILVFATFPTPSSDHRYNYAAWNGTVWVVNQICTAGGPIATNLGFDPGQTYYSGGVSLDHTDPSIVYVSRNIGSQWEIWRYHTADGGATWTSVQLTTGSAQPQVRPVGIRGRVNDLAALWLNGSYPDYEAFNQGVQGTGG